nr:xylulose kinase-1 [Tanacetum cinerariifolium]
MKKGEYYIWAMKIEHYLEHIDYPIWEVIQKGNAPVQVSTDTNGQIRVLPPKTTEEILARERERERKRERKARTTLLMAIPEDRLAKFHKMTDAKEIWEVIKSRFGGNDESKKMQKYLLKQQFESFLYPIQRDYTKVNEFDLEEMDLKWQVAMISTRLKKFYKKTGRKLHFDAKERIGFDKSKVKCFNCHNTGHFARESRSKENQDSVNWTGHAEDDTEDYALMAFNSSNLGSDTEKLKKEKEELKTKLENFQSSSKGLSKLLNSQMSAKEKSGLGSSDVKDTPMHYRFAKVKGMHAVPPLMTRNYMPPKIDFGIDYSSEETLETMPKLVDSKPKVVNEPKVWTDAPIIKEYESDSDDEHVTIPSKEHEKPSFAFVNTVEHMKTHRKTAKEQTTCSQNPKPSKRDWNGLMSKKLGLGYGFTKKNKEIIELCGSKGIKREYSNARTPQKNGVAERKNMILIEAARTMLADSFLPNTFWAEAGSTACYVLNKPITAENKANRTAGPKETNNSADNKEPVDQDDQDFLKEFERLKRQAKEADDVAKTLRKTFAQGTEDLLLQAGAARASSTNYVNIASTPVNTSSTPVNTASPSKNSEDIYEVPNDEIFTSASYDAEGLVCAAQRRLPIFMLLILGKKMQFGLVLWALNGNYEVRAARHKVIVARQKGEGSGAPIEPQPIPSPTHPSTGDQPPVTESSSTHDTTQDSLDLEGTNGSEGDQVQSPHDSPLSGGHTSNRSEGALNLDELFSICTNFSNRVLALETVKDAQVVEIITLKARIKKLEKKCKPSISHHRAWLKSVQRLSMKKRFGKKEFVSKQGRKKDKPEPNLDDSTFDADHDIDYMDTEEPVNKGRLCEETEELVSTARLEDSTVRPDVGEETEELVSTARPEDSTVRPDSDKAKEKEVSIKDIKDFSRPARSILTLKPLPTIDLKDKGKGVLEEPKPTKKRTRSDLDVAQIAKDAEVARLVYEEELAELEREKEKRHREEEEEREEYTIEERAKFLAETIAAQRKFRAAQRYAVIKRDKESIKKRPGRRLKIKATKKSKRQKTDSDLKEEEHLKTFLQIVPDEEGEVDYEVLDKRFSIINWETMFKKTIDDDLWKNQEEWILNSWNFYENCGVHTLTLEDGTKIYKLAERRYPLTKETLERMLALRLIAECKSEAVFDLLRFIQKQVDESRSYDGSEKDL